MRNRVSALSILLATSFLFLQASAAGASSLSHPVADGAVQVTTDPGAARGHATPALAVDPKDPQTMVVAEGDAYSSRCMVHVSRDGGLTWTDGTQPVTPPDWAGCGFAVTGALADLAFTPDGSTLYYAWSAYQQTTFQQRIYLARSTDLGLTWDVTALPRIGPDPAKREFGADAMPSLVVDRDDPSRIYVAWWSNNGTWNLPSTLSGADSSVWCRLVDNANIARPYVAVSTDAGKTFSNPVDMAPGVDRCTTEPYLAQAKDGSLLAFFGQATRTLTAGQAPPAHLFMSRSADHGKTFTVSTVHTQETRTDPGVSTATSDWLSAPSPAVDLKNGNIYVAWESLGGAVPSIEFRRSTDNGRTWGSVVKVNDVDGKRSYHFPEAFPVVGVAPNGRIDVVWYDYRNDAGYQTGDKSDAFQDVYYSSSSDGGKTFAKNIPVNDRTIDRRFGPHLTSIDGPLGLASTDTAANVAWDDTRNGNSVTAAQDIYFTRVRWATAGDVYGGAAKSSGTSPWVAGVFGGAIAVAVAGVVIVLIALAYRRRTPRSTTRTTTPPAKEPSVT
jgi:hypothetical protein